MNTEELCCRCCDYPCRCLSEQIEAEEKAAMDPRNYEPECTCTRVDVDIYDARGCELCDPQSEWNKACKAMDRDEIQTVDEREEIGAIWNGFEHGGCDDAPF